MSDKDTRRDYARQSWRIRMGEAVQDALGMIVLLAMAGAYKVALAGRHVVWRSGRAFWTSTGKEKSDE